MKDQKKIMEELQGKGYAPVYIWDAEPEEEDHDHDHPFDTHLFILQGEIQIRMAGQATLLTELAEIDIPRGVLHYARAGREGCRYIVAERHS